MVRIFWGSICWFDKGDVDELLPAKLGPQLDIDLLSAEDGLPLY
jgi:hypothetical protein